MEKDMKKANGYLSMVLHTHLPYVNHPENDNYIEEEPIFLLELTGGAVVLANNQKIKLFK